MDLVERKLILMDRNF